MYFIYLFYVNHVCFHLNVHCVCLVPHKSEGGIRSPRTRITNDCQLSYRYSESNPVLCKNNKLS